MRIRPDSKHDLEIGVHTFRCSPERREIGEAFQQMSIFDSEGKTKVEATTNDELNSWSRVSVTYSCSRPKGVSISAPISYVQVFKNSSGPVALNPVEFATPWIFVAN